MAKHTDTGKIGEQLAEKYFSGLGYNILQKNWRYSHWEVDIIASKNNALHFVEVKTRTSVRQGMPEESISASKISSVTEAARIYLYEKHYKDIRFDVISIILKKNEDFEILHIKDAFY
jgi:putative endonuclease